MLSQIAVTIDIEKQCQFAQDENFNTYFMADSGIYQISDDLKHAENLFDGSKYTASVLADKAYIIEFGIRTENFYARFSSSKGDFIYKYRKR